MQYSKYKNKKTAVNNITFDSRAEANRYLELKLLEKSGKIDDLRLQPRFLLQDKFFLKNKTYRKIEYIADFKYFDKNLGKYVVEDVKGKETDVFKLKMKIFLKLYGEKFDFKIIK